MIPGGPGVQRQQGPGNRPEAQLRQGAARSRMLDRHHLPHPNLCRSMRLERTSTPRSAWEIVESRTTNPPPPPPPPPHPPPPALIIPPLSFFSILSFDSSFFLLMILSTFLLFISY